MNLESVVRWNKPVRKRCPKDAANQSERKQRTRAGSGLEEGGEFVFNGCRGSVLLLWERMRKIPQQIEHS